MRFRRIEIQRFGPLAGIDSGEDSSLPGLIAVLGPNEAGKSAFHQLLEATLYGFHPANGEQNPFTPWAGGHIDIMAELQLRAGSSITVRRRLMKTPRTEMTRDGAVENLDNRPLPAVGTIDRKVFSEVYAITLGQLTGLRKTAWETVQEQLIVGMGAQDLRSARAVIRGLRDAAKKLWQPSNRGKQLHRTLRGELATLGQNRREAEIRAAELRALGAELRELDERLQVLSEERAVRTKRFRVLRELPPLKSRVDTLDDLERSLGDRLALAKVPKDPVGMDQELNDRMAGSKRRLDDLGKSLERADSVADHLSEAERRVMERELPLRSLASSAPLIHERSSRRGHLEAEVAAFEGGIREASLALLGVWPTGGTEPTGAKSDPVDWSVVGEGFRSLEMAALRAKVEDAQTQHRRRTNLQERSEQLSDRDSRGTPLVSFWTMLFVAASAGIVLGGAVVAEPVVSMIGAVLVLLSAGFLAHTLSRRSAAGQIRDAVLKEEESLRAQITEAVGRERLALAAARKLLIPLGLQASHLSAPENSLVVDIGDLKNLFHSRHERIIELGRLRDEAAIFDQKFDRLVPDLELELPEDRGIALLELGRILQRLDARRVRAEEAEAERTRLNAALEREWHEYDQLVERRQKFEACIKKAGGTLDEAGLQVIAGRLVDLERFAGLWDELEREVGDVLDLHHRIALAEVDGEDWSDAPGRLIAEEEELDSIEQESQNLRGRRVQLTESEKILCNEDTMDLVDGQILHVQAQIREVERDRDRSIVLARLLEQAEAQFRSVHQPDLLRKAAEHLHTITSGRYERILVGEIGDERGFFLDAPHLPEPTAVAAPLSTSTREQVYLALRLAIIEHLDKDAEPLPLLMDETLVNWDPDRRNRFLDLLGILASQRQIFLFTCHPHIAEEVTDRGGMLLELSPS
jgi:uncharacterized protein YhaN